MVQRVLRVVFTLLALLMGIASTQGLKQINVNAAINCDEVGCYGCIYYCFINREITCYTNNIEF